MKEKTGILIGVGIIMFVAVIATSYALFQVTLSGKKNYRLSVGTLDFELEQEENAIRLNNAYPMTDEEGKTLNPYVFTLHNTGDLTVMYQISLEEDEEQKNACSGCTFLSNDKLKYELKEGTSVVGSTFLSDVGNVLTSGNIEGGATKKFELRLWLEEESTTAEENKYYFAKIKIEAEQQS